MTTTVDRSEALVERLFGATIDTLELYSIYLGPELGLYAGLERDCALTAADLPKKRRDRAALALARPVPRRLGTSLRGRVSQSARNQCLSVVVVNACGRLPYLSAWRPSYSRKAHTRSSLARSGKPHPTESRLGACPPGPSSGAPTGLR